MHLSVSNDQFITKYRTLITTIRNKNKQLKSRRVYTVSRKFAKCFQSVGRVGLVVLVVLGLVLVVVVVLIVLGLVLVVFVKSDIPKKILHKIWIKPGVLTPC